MVLLILWCCVMWRCDLVVYVVVVVCDIVLLILCWCVLWECDLVVYVVVVVGDNGVVDIVVVCDVGM